MKKSIFAFLVLFVAVLVIGQDGFANVKLNVNAKSTATNKLLYTEGETEKSFSLAWKEKALYGDGNGETTEGVDIKPNITVINAVEGDLIVKVDIVTYLDDEIVVESYWLKYGYVTDPVLGYEREYIELLQDEDTTTRTDVNDVETIDKADLETLCLVKDLSKSTTITLFDFTMPESALNGCLIFTAILVDDVTADSPQVIGVDVQTVFFDPDWETIVKSSN